MPQRAQRWEPRSSHRDSGISEEDRRRRAQAFQDGIERTQRLFAAHVNGERDPHLQVVIDCAYPATKDSLQLASSLENQIRNCIGHNRRSLRPSKLWITEWPTGIVGEAQFDYVYDERFMKESARQRRAPIGMTREEMTTRFESNQFPPFIRAILQSDSRVHNVATPSKHSDRSWPCAVDDRTIGELFRPERVVYLSPDSANLLLELHTDLVYVIGGLVDRTVVKGVSFARARKCGFDTARLPVKEFIGGIMKGTSMNVDTVFKLVLDCSQLQHAERQKRADEGGYHITDAPPLPFEVVAESWRTAFRRHIPQRHWVNKTLSLDDARRAAGEQLDQQSNESMPVPSSTRSGSTHLRRQEPKWMFQYQRQRVKIDYD